ncbi:Ig-like domain-containing protein [Microbacterium sp. ARD32]|uniref:Ig-like domain-containing protein n=1 Tax=Microbacterium sp. ARD32 TaxID=2962577 RepID=UPI00288166C9|nr:Ig-like domain-containing protein [Microbacterium sp. ARD32]MDT0156115.1 Ig-like domain-containing protein [Microbacterium sp. ARD32]
MRMLSWMRARPKAIAAGAGVAIGAVVLTGMAVAYDGLPTAKVDLNDAGVWLTKTSSLLVGHFNHESTVLDGGLRTAGESYDILQDQSSVLIVDSGSNTIAPVDPARVSLAGSVKLAGESQVALGASTVAVMENSSGRLWVMAFSALSGFDPRSTEPVVTLGENSAVTVGADGAVYGVAGAKGQIVTIETDAQGAPAGRSTTEIGKVDKHKRPTITAVGSVPVVLDGSGTVLAPDGVRSEITTDGSAVLQQVSAQTDAVTVATADSLVRVPLDGGEPTRQSVPGSGAPAAPVFLQGCTYGAWAGSARFIRDCAGERADVAEKIPGAKSRKHLTFRVNRDVIVLNDIVSGAAWLADESMQRVDDWTVLTPPKGETEDEDERTTEETVETTLPKRGEKNTPPTAEDDPGLGVRPGATTMLPVLDNDNDPDGDVLVASLVGAQPSVGVVQPVLDGAALQIAVPEDARGSASFRYQADDGRSGTDTARVRVSVHEWSVNAAPKSKRPTRLAVESGGTISYNVLPDWIDPDGDDIYLREVVAAPGDEVEFTTGGQITYRALGSLQGRKEVQVTVSDGLGETATGIIRLDVQPAGSTLPKTNADHVVTRPGVSVTVSPLTNDASSGREQLRLAGVDPVAGASIDSDFPNKQFTFTAQKSGVYYVQYLVAAGPNAVPGLVRVDVLDTADSDLPPVAVRDVALLPAGGEVLLDPLANDSDPAGGVLVLQSASLDDSARGVSVSVLEHQTLRIGDQGGMNGPTRIEYRISNGTRSAVGEVVVLPIPAPERVLAPVALDDQAVVRAGDVVTIPVLANDSHPSGDAIHVVPELVEPLVDPADGEIFVSQDTVRFRAGDEPKTVSATYEIVDSMGQKAAAYIRIQIVPVDRKTNAAPTPRDLTVRTLSGATQRIAIPLDGLDQDGDSVELLGLGSSPLKGRVAETGQDFLSYEAFEDSTGVDTFTYRVRDRLGREGIGTIRVGIAPREKVNQAPYAVKDSVVVRPDREVAVPVLANDSDPEGGKIVLVKDGISQPDVDGVKARALGDRVLVRVPDREFETSVRYTIVDELGATASAAIAVTVDPDVPLKAPIARDDRVLVTDVKDTATVDVDVLANDEDPDGTTQALSLDVGAGGTLRPDETVRVTVGEKAHIVRYTITDRDEKQASAFIFVPALADMRPILTSVEPVVVKSGETKVLPLADYVTVFGGGRAIITETAKAKAPHSNGDNLVKDENTLVYTPADGYFGKDSLTFEVTDGDRVDDPKGRKATLTIPITVLPPENQPPAFTDAELSVAPGEKATTLDLAALASDPDPDDEVSFRLTGGSGNGITARVEGTTLSVEAAKDVPKGTTANLVLSVTDGTADPIQGRVTVTVTASTRDLPIATDDVRDEVDQGEPITIDVLENDINPFPDTPLSVISASPETGRGEVVLDGDQVTITPDPDFVGMLVARYRIQDATGDPDRAAEGRIRLTVQGVPDAPGTPTVTSVTDRQVVLSWGSPVNNGAEITKYTVRAVQGGAYSKECESTTCTLDKLTNDVEYVFQVTATNRVGESEPSPSSEVARPDTRPDTPSAPTLAFGDHELKVDWTAPSSSGSPVESYTLEISPAPPSGATQLTGITGTSTVWKGLENGREYQVRIQAHNRAPQPSEWSLYSRGETPAGPPKAPAQPTTAELDPVGSKAQMKVSWVAPDDNGAAISGYELNIMRGGAVVGEPIMVAAGVTSQAVQVDPSETGYTFRVRAMNKAPKPGDWSRPSAERRGVLAPGAPTGVRATPGDNTVTVAFAPGPLNGAKSGEVSYEYRIGENGTWNAMPGDKVIRSGVANNSTYYIYVRGVARVAGTSTKAGAVSAGSNAAKPFGAPNTPSLSASVSGQEITWHIGATTRNGRDVTVSWADNRGHSGTVGTGGGNVPLSYGWSTPVSFTVTVTDKPNSDQPAAPQTRTVTANSGTGAKPLPEVWVSRGGRMNGTCNYVRVATSADFPGGKYLVTVWKNGVFSANNEGNSQSIAAGASTDLKSWICDGEAGKTVTVSFDGVSANIHSTTW